MRWGETNWKYKDSQINSIQARIGYTSPALWFTKNKQRIGLDFKFDLTNAEATPVFIHVRWAVVSSSTYWASQGKEAKGGIQKPWLKP